MDNRQTRLVSHSPEETFRLGETIGNFIKNPLVIALNGDLGSGKTVFVKGLARGLEVPGNYYITSPTFTLINEYPGRWQLVHIDLYRLENVGDLEDIGLDDLLYDQAVIAVEWADKLFGDLPERHLAIHFETTGDEDREISLITYGHNGIDLIKAIEKKRNLEKYEPNCTKIRRNFSRKS
jgi:tRNA threonylcarbamoyladenosine biosynthesis protein TsaE